MSEIFLNDITFEEWADLATSDPQEFEKLRQDNITALIESAPLPRQQRLRGLQWQIDLIRERHKDSSMAACIAISELMWETFERLSNLLQAQTGDGLHDQITECQASASIIPFPNKTKL